jgi:DNA-binding helix-hairpin-helix protein with protein kinase domain
MRQILNLLPVFGQWLSLLLCMAFAILICSSPASVVLGGVISSAVWNGPNRASPRFKVVLQSRRRRLARRAEQDEAAPTPAAVVIEDKPSADRGETA